MTASVEKIPAGSTAVESILKAAADGLRLNILRTMRRNSYGVMELCTLLDIKQSAMSHHLKQLAHAGLVTTRREGNAIYYRRALPDSTGDPALVTQLFASLDAHVVSDEIQGGIARLRQQRSLHASQYFAEQREQIKAGAEFIAPLDRYRDVLNTLLDTLFSGQRSQAGTKQAIEIGPGEGSYLADLSARFEHVIALDCDDAMLERCRRTATRYNLDNIGFIQGDTDDLLELSIQLEAGSAVSARKANCIVANMVLHHNEQPGLIFSDVGKLLSSNGIFMVSELQLHEQQWTREALGDHWQGFDEMQLLRWAAGAGLKKIASSYTALSNGFGIQIHAFQTTVEVV